LIAFENLEVRYAGSAVPALKGLSLSLDRGIVGLLGPNGAGKSTLLKALLGLLIPSRGSGTVLGVALGATEAARLRARIGYMPEYDALIEDASAYEQVAFWGELSGLAPEAARDRAHEVLYFVGLDESRYRPVSGYSTGMRQRVKLAQALVHSPELIFLDEPTNGLDPDGRRRMLDLVLRVHAELGTGVILASHLLGDVERVADQLVILDQGQIKAAGSMAGLRKALSKRVELRFLDPLDAAQESRIQRAESEVEVWRSLVPGNAFRTDRPSPFMESLFGATWPDRVKTTPDAPLVGADGVTYRVRSRILHHQERLGWYERDDDTQPGHRGFLAGWTVGLGMDNAAESARIQTLLRSWGADVESWGTVPPREGPYPSVLLWAREPSILSVWREDDLLRRRPRWIQIGGPTTEGPHARLEPGASEDGLRHLLEKLLSRR